MKWKIEKDIQKAQKASKPKKTTKPIVGGTMVAAEKMFFFGFPRKRLVFAMHGLQFCWKTNFFLRKSWFWELRPLKNQLFPKEKLVFLGKTNFFLGKPKENNFFSSHHSSSKSWFCCFFGFGAFCAFCMSFSIFHFI